MRKRVLFLVIAIAMILGTVIPGIALAESGFAVGPARLDVTVAGDGSSLAYVYVTSYLNGELVVGMENLSFRVEPETIPITATDRNRKVELTVYGDSSLAAGQYSGKLTFLLYTGNNVAYGVKMDAYITQESTAGTPTSEPDEPDGFLDKVIDIVEENYIIIAVVAGVIIVLLLGILIGRKSRKSA